MEIILVDDASADNGATLQLMMNYEKQYPDNITVIPMEQNLRQGGARNVGIRYATGEYLIFCDADDWLVLSAMDNLYTAAKNYDADIIDFKMQTILPGTEADDNPKAGNGSYLLEIDTEEKRRSFVINTNETSTLGCMRKFYRLSVIREHNIHFAEQLICEEPSFTLPLRFYVKRKLYLDAALYCYCLRQGSTLNSSWDERKLDNMKVWISIVEDLEERGLLEQYHQEIETLFFEWEYDLGLSMLLKKGYTLSVDELELFRNILLTLFPDVRNNKILRDFDKASIKTCLQLLDSEYTADNVDELNRLLRQTLMA